MCSSFVDREATDLCVLILYLATLLNKFISCSSDEVFRFFYEEIISVNKDTFDISPTYLYPFCLTALAKTSTRTLNRRGESGHPSLVPDFSFSLFSMVLVVGLL